MSDTKLHNFFHSEGLLIFDPLLFFQSQFFLRLIYAVVVAVVE